MTNNKPSFSKPNWYMFSVTFLPNMATHARQKAKKEIQITSFKTPLPALIELPPKPWINCNGTFFMMLEPSSRGLAFLTWSCALMRLEPSLLRFFLHVGILNFLVSETHYQYY